MFWPDPQASEMVTHLAQHAGMPHSAVAAAAVDLVLPAGEIAVELARIGRHPYVESPTTAQGDADHASAPNGLRQIFLILRSATGTDFRGYKAATVRRRVARRMLVHRIETLEGYARHLRQHPAEVQALHDDLLIQVTGLFRDPQGYEALRQTVFPSLVKERAADDPIRIWVPGCATGEEAYSLVVCLLEFLGETGRNLPIQMFATDLSAAAVTRARTGTFSASIENEVAPDRLWTNRTAEAGQVLVLTKALGTGVISTAIKKQKAESAWVDAATASMTTLNKSAAEMLAGLLGVDRFTLYLDPARRLSTPTITRFLGQIERRAARVPCRDLRGLWGSGHRTVRAAQRPAGLLQQLLRQGACHADLSGPPSPVESLRAPPVSGRRRWTKARHRK